MSEIDLHGDENKSKKRQIKNIYFFKFDLKIIRTNSYNLKCLIRLSYTSR